MNSRFPNPISRRRLIMASGLFAASAVAAPATAGATALYFDANASDPTNDRMLYFPETGHHLSGEYLRMWGRTGGMVTLGPPVSEPTTKPFVEYQAFRNGVLYRDLEYWLTPPLPGKVNILPVGSTLAPRFMGSGNPRRGDPSASYWFWQTKFGTHTRLWQTFLDGGGVFVFGYPISHLVQDSGTRVQWFQNTRLELNDNDEVGISPLGEWMADELKLDTRRVPMRPGAFLFDGVSNPVPIGRVQDRRIEIDLSLQRLAAFQGDKRVYDVLVSTGRELTPTPTGIFPILRRVENERMIGGEFGTDDYYDLSNVYFTQYFTWKGHALHYAYWHNNFGSEMSHGCVNMTLWDAKWMWNFADSGVPITIR
ncbi:MAG: L,D-transpeptidase [Chloroflexi bacterium]|nr:L,D-transpeptidase [Chloroflexota bacterium]